MQMLQKEAAQAKALHQSLTHVAAILSEKEGQMKLYWEQMRILEKQTEMCETTLSQVIKGCNRENQKMASQEKRHKTWKSSENCWGLVLASSAKSWRRETRRSNSRRGWSHPATCWDPDNNSLWRSSLTWCLDRSRHLEILWSSTSGS